MSSVEQKIADEFEQRYKRPAEFVACAPGRVNLIGGHTDYNDGLVLPLAIDRKVEVWASPRTDSIVNLYSRNFSQVYQFDLCGKLEQDEVGWPNYVKAVANELLKSGRKLTGLDAIIFGDVPIASGLSSSAAIEVAFILAFAKAAQLTMPSPLEVAKLAQSAEFNFIGVHCGLMDQFISAAGVEGHALRIDCTDMAYERIPMPDHVSIVVGDTKLSRSLAGSAYNQRRRECEEALQWIKQNLHSGKSQIQSIRDVTIDVLETSRGFLPDVLFRRLHHVATENERVIAAVQALQTNDMSMLGRLLNASHASLRDDYEVSSKGLDAMVACMREIEGCFGARMTGAGFGGCAIALVDKEVTTEFMDHLAGSYSRRQGIVAEIFATHPSNGGQITNVSTSNPLG